MLPVKIPLDTKGTGPDGFTVIVKLTDAPLQPVPEVIKLPNEPGTRPTASVVAIVLLARSIIETVPAPWFATYRLVPPEFTDMPSGDGQGIVAMTLLFTVLSTDILP